MKKITLLYAALFAILSVSLLSCATSESTRAEKAARKAQLKKKIAEDLSNRHFTIDIDRAYPESRSGVINLTSPYSVTISGDTIISYLPFFGRAYNVPYGGGKGLNFTGRIRNYEKSVSKKGEQNVRIEVDSDEDNYLYFISIYGGGNASINVQPHQRSHISFTGTYHIEE